MGPFGPFVLIRMQASFQQGFFQCFFGFLSNIFRASRICKDDNIRNEGGLPEEVEKARTKRGRLGRYVRSRGRVDGKLNGRREW